MTVGPTKRFLGKHDPLVGCMSQFMWDIGLSPVSQSPTVAPKQPKLKATAKAKAAAVEAVMGRKTRLTGNMVSTETDYRSWWATLLWSRWHDEQGCSYRPAPVLPGYLLPVSMMLP